MQISYDNIYSMAFRSQGFQWEAMHTSGIVYKPIADLYLMNGTVEPETVTNHMLQAMWDEGHKGAEQKHRIMMLMALDTLANASVPSVLEASAGFHSIRFNTTANIVTSIDYQKHTSYYVESTKYLAKAKPANLIDMFMSYLINIEPMDQFRSFKAWADQNLMEDAK